MFRTLRIGALILFGICCLYYVIASSEKGKENTSYPEHLVGAFTGGFGEKTCHSCHFDYELNWEEGSLEVSGLPEELVPGQSYSIEIKVYREDLGKAGFQMTARDESGRQAGIFSISVNERVMLTKQVPDSLKYVQHSALGTEPNAPGSNRWVIEWKAPEILPDTIYFNVASNAANGDASEFGDWIYTEEVVRY